MLYRPPSIHRINGVRIALVLAVLLVCYQLYSLAFQIYKDSQIDIQYQSVLAENAKMRREIVELTQLVAYLQTPSYREKEQKKIANLIKPGEKVLLLERPSVSTPGGATSIPATEQTPDTGPEETRTVPERWWEYLFGEDEILERPVDRDVTPTK